MRFSLLLWMVIPLTTTVGPPAAAAVAASRLEAYHIVLARDGVGAGELVDLRLSPPPPKGWRVSWIGTSNWLGHGDAAYQAPYVIPAGTPPAQVTVSLTGPGVRTGASAEIKLFPGSVPGASECLGPGQSFLLDRAGISFQYIDQLPELIHRVEPDYPRSQYVRGVEDTMMIQALVCRSGHVLDAHVLQRYRDIRDLQPIDQDARLADAAVAAVMQFVFAPAMASGQPVAVSINIPIAFRR